MRTRYECFVTGDRPDTDSVWCLYVILWCPSNEQECAKLCKIVDWRREPWSSSTSIIVKTFLQPGLVTKAWKKLHFKAPGVGVPLLIGVPNEKHSYLCFMFYTLVGIWRHRATSGHNAFTSVERVPGLAETQAGPPGMWHASCQHRDDKKQTMQNFGIFVGTFSTKEWIFNCSNLKLLCTTNTFLTPRTRGKMLEI